MAAKLNRWEFMLTLGSRASDGRNGIPDQRAGDFGHE
jgi:hypothetical protein